MSGENQEIKIVGVDKEEIKVGGNKDEWIIPFKLSATPDESWQKKFYEVQQKDSSVMKRKSRVIENFIKIEISSVDDLQKILDALKIEVAEANALCEEDYQTKMRVRQELEALQKKQRDSTAHFKEDSDKLVF